MAEVRDTKYYLSLLRQTAINTFFTTAADFQRILPNSPLGVFPENQAFDDVGRGGREFAGTVCPVSHWELIGYQLPIPLDFDTCGRLLLRAWGATPTNTTPSTGVRLYASAMLAKATSRQLPGSSLIVLNDGFSFRYGDMVVAQASISQNALDRPLATFDLLNTGHNVNPHGVATLSDAITDIPCLTGAGTTITLTDDVSTRDIMTEDVRSHSWTLTNPLITDPDRTRKANDPSVGPTGAVYKYITKLLHNGFRTFTAQINVVFGASTIPYWILGAKKYVITNLIFKYVGPIIGGTDPYFIAVTIPKCTIRATPAADLNSDMGYTLNIVASEDSVTLGGSTLQVQNNQTSNFS